MYLIHVIYVNHYRKKYLYKIKKFFTSKRLYYYKYNWCSYKNFLKLKPKFEFTQFFKLKNKKLNKLNIIIEAKKETGFFKKYFNIKRVILRYFKKFTFGKKFLLKFFKLKRKKKFFKKNYRGSLQNIDFTNRFNLVFYKNRKILQYLLLNKNKRQHILSKFLKKFVHQKSNNYINYLEYSLLSILIKSQFINNIFDAIFLIKNNHVYINNKIITTVYYNISACDVIRLVYNDYYSFFRKNLHNLIKTSNKVSFNTRRWNKIGGNEISTKKMKTIFKKILYFNKDVPNYLEVDYINMTIFVLYKNINYMNINYLNKKFINYYLLRLYNWKYIT